MNKVPAGNESHDRGYDTLLSYYGDPEFKTRRINEIF